jgi:hypothetical protein
MAGWTLPHEQQAFLFDQATIDAAKKFTVQR